MTFSYRRTPLSIATTQGLSCSPCINTENRSDFIVLNWSYWTDTDGELENVGHVATPNAVFLLHVDSRSNYTIKLVADVSLQKNYC